MDSVHKLIQLANKVGFGEMPIDNVPTDFIMQATAQAYRKYCEGDETFFETRYGSIISTLMQDGDSASLGNLLLVIANNIAIIERLEEDTRELKSDRNFRDSAAKRFYAQKEHYKNTIKVLKWRNEHDINEPEPFTGKGCIYSVITGNYDDVKEPDYIDSKFNYILFTNNKNIQSDFWNVIYLDNFENLNDVMLQRKIKILGHDMLDDYDFTVYIDGKMKIIGSISEFINEYKKQEPLLCFPHPSWNNLVEEANRIMKLKKADEKILEHQVNDYIQEGCPIKYGLIDSAILVRENHNNRLKNTMEAWWKQLIKYSHRDQMSFPYACWKSDFVYDTVPLEIYNNKYFRLYNHNL